MSLPGRVLLTSIKSPRFIAQLTELLNNIHNNINNLSNGYISAYLSHTAAPTTGSHLRGDKVYNSAPSELGTAGSKYIIIGWICTVSGNPGTWLEMRTLTGN